MSRGLGDVYKRQIFLLFLYMSVCRFSFPLISFRLSRAKYFTVAASLPIVIWQRSRPTAMASNISLYRQKKERKSYNRGRLKKERQTQLNRSCSAIFHPWSSCSFTWRKRTNTEKRYYTFTYHLTAGGRWGTTNDCTASFLPFPCSPLPSGTWRAPGLSSPWCYIYLVFKVWIPDIPQN